MLDGSPARAPAAAIAATFLGCSDGIAALTPSTIREPIDPVGGAGRIKCSRSGRTSETPRLPAACLRTFAKKVSMPGHSIKSVTT